MNERRSEHSNKWLGLVWTGMLLLLTGCPNNEYQLELTPRGRSLQRTLTFYRQDGIETNGLPKYQAFPQDELVLITKCYGASKVTKDGERHFASGLFSGSLPADLGGSGSYVQLSNHLGAASIYLERFRVEDDLSGRLEKRVKAADRLTDLVIGWSEDEFGRERNYRKLRRFFDVDFRRDLKNFTLYGWMAQESLALRTTVWEEMAFRFGQYLVERGYLKIEEAPEVFRIASNNGSDRLMHLIQRLVAARLELPAAGPLPRSLAVLSDADTAWNSWLKYLKTTPVYRDRLRHWQKEKILTGVRRTQQQVADFLLARGRTNRVSTGISTPTKPDPSDVAAELTIELLELELFGDTDHLTVKLTLPAAPSRTNGKWDAAHLQVVWDSELPANSKAGRLPPFCYASWSEPNESFQIEHFGKVVLRGEGLTQYCLWRASLEAPQARQWDGMLLALKADENANRQLEKFRFSDEPTGAGSLADLARELFHEGTTNGANSMSPAK